MTTFAPYERFSRWQDQPAGRRDEAYVEMKKDLSSRLLEKPCHGLATAGEPYYGDLFAFKFSYLLELHLLVLSSSCHK